MVGKTALNKEMKHLNGAYFRTIIITTVNDRFVFIFLDFLFLDQSSFFGSDTFKKYRCRFVIRILRYKFALYRPLKYAVF